MRLLACHKQFTNVISDLGRGRKGMPIWIEARDARADLRMLTVMRYRRRTSKVMLPL